MFCLIRIEKHYIVCCLVYIQKMRSLLHHYIPGYLLNEKIHSGVNTIVYRGELETEHTPVIVKILKAEYPTLDAITCLKHEYLVAESLEHENIVKVINFKSEKKQIAIIYEDFGGISLKEFIAGDLSQKLSENPDGLQKTLLHLVLNVALSITNALIYLHGKNIIHKDMKGENIIINPHTLQVKLTDFSISSRLSKETPQQAYPGQLEGTLAYMSPEQTGRMNRTLDYRTDFYSLGVTLYEILTSELPYQSNDPLELLHCHIAQKIPDVREKNPHVPNAIAQIITKLMAKNAEDRYQSGKGLLADFERCLKDLNTTGVIQDFTPGRFDVRSQLLIPQKLYGREEQVASLLAAFDRVSQGGSEIVLVSGYSGIGKTSVINEVNKPITKAHGNFISGKWDQFNRNIPYASIAQAFSVLIKQLLAESAEQLEVWKNRILEVVGANGQVIIDLIPEVELLIGKQPQVVQLDPVESQSRFHRILQQFIRVFTRKEHPLVIFLDDLQWADSATLKLIQLLLTDSNSKYLLIIGAYRDNEVSSTHPLINTIEEITKNDVNVNNIYLNPLTLENATELVTETLNNNTSRSYELAELIFNKTAGNPFFITQLIQAMYQEQLLTFNFSEYCWQWNIEEIQAIEIADKSVVELLASRMLSLPERTQEILKIAACIGNKFNLDTLSIVTDYSSYHIANNLYSAMHLGLILPLNDSYKVPMVFCQEENSESNLIFDVSRVGYKFLHDRVQEAAYSLITENERECTHLKIGLQLLDKTPSKDIEINIFDIVNQLNVGIKLLKQEDEKDELGSLNFIAGCKAKKATAYEAAQKYLHTAIVLSETNSWESKYDAVLKLYIEATEVAYLSGNFEQMEKLADIVLQQAKTLLDKVKVYEIKILSYIAQKKLLEAIKIGLLTSKLLGINLPESPTEADIGQIIGETSALIPQSGIEELINLPLMTDAHSYSTLRILHNIAAATYIAKPNLLPLVILSQVKLSIIHGNASFSAAAYATYGIILCGILNDIDSGYQFGKLALDLLSKFNDKQISAKVFCIVGLFTQHWKQHLQDSLSIFQLGCQNGLESGNLEYAAFNYYHECQYLYLIGQELPSLKSKIKTYSSAISGLKQELQLNYNEMLRQVVIGLMGNSDNPWILIGEAYNEEQEVAQYHLVNDVMGLYYLYLHKLILCYLFKQYKEALDNSQLAAKCLGGVPAQPVVPLLYFYDSLVQLAVYDSLSQSEKNNALEKVQANQEKMQRWACNAPMNYQHKYDLVAAELCRILGKKYQAMELYDQAIAGANANEYIQEEAMACELAAEFYLARNQEKIARIYITDAYYGYIKWGAYAKVKDLEERYPHLIIRNMVQSSKVDVKTTISNTISASLGTKIGSTSGFNQNLDLASVIKASESIQASMQMENLPHHLLGIIIENAAAQKGCMLLEKNDIFQIEAIRNAKADDPVTLQSIPVEKSDILPQSAINYVSRTQKPLVISDADKDPITKNDPYVAQHKCKSILCLPIQYQGKLIGIFYLENNLVSSAFTSKHVELVKILATQAAISITNAQLLVQEKQKSQQIQESLEQLEIIQGQLVEKAQDLEAALTKLQNTQSQLVHTEKISALGQLVAGVAHEVNNPVSFISGNLSHAEQYVSDLVNHLKLYQKKYGDDEDEEIVEDAETIELEFILDDLPQMLTSMKLGTVRIKEIMQSLRNFSRNDGDQKRTVDITEGINSTILILGHRLKAGPQRPAIKIIKEYDTNLPEIECYPGQLNQVFMNLLANAIDALEESNEGKTYQEIEKNPNTITISTTIESNWLQISIKDNGLGMSEETRQNLFTAFFTTKPEGKGTGLGLSISYQIVTENHDGTLDCISQPGNGAEFVIRIPVS